MADRKISDLTALTAPASGDYLPIVDISEAAAANKNKRITIEELFRGVPLGTAAAPSIAIEGDENTGIYSPGADQLAISTNGTGRLFVDASGNVGVGASLPASALDVSGGSIKLRNASSGTNFGYEVDVNHTTGVSQKMLTARYMIAGQSGSYIDIASINAEIVNAGTNEYGLSLRTGSALTSRLWIAPSGNVGIGVTSPRQALTFGSLTSSSTSTPDCIDLGATYTSTSASTNLKFKLYIDSSGNTYGFTVNGNSHLEYYAGTVSSPGNHVFLTGGSERARIDSSGRLLVGTSSSSSIYGAQSALQVSGTDYSTASISILRNSNTSADSASLYLGRRRTGGIVSAQDRIGLVAFAAHDGTGTDIPAATIEAWVDGTPGANDMPGRLVFSTTADEASSPTERMRIGNAGVINTYTATGDSLNIRNAAAAGTATGLIYGLYSATSTSNGTVSFTVWSNGNVVNTNGSYGTISDAKLKENIVDARSQWDDIKSLQVRNYNFKEGQTHTQIGLVAQEVELVSPGLVTESPDRDADGNNLGTVTKSVNLTVLYMKAVKALQEAMERIEQLEADVAALKAQ